MRLHGAAPPPLTGGWGDAGAIRIGAIAAAERRRACAQGAAQGARGGESAEASSAPAPDERRRGRGRRCREGARKLLLMLLPAVKICQRLPHVREQLQCETPSWPLQGGRDRPYQVETASAESPVKSSLHLDENVRILLDLQHRSGLGLGAPWHCMACQDLN